MATLWVEGHDPVRATTGDSVHALEAEFGAGWKGEEKTNKLALSVLLLLNRAPFHVTADEVGNVGRILIIEFGEIAWYAERLTVVMNVFHRRSLKATASRHQPKQTELQHLGFS